MTLFEGENSVVRNTEFSDLYGLFVRSDCCCPLGRCAEGDLQRYVNGARHVVIPATDQACALDRHPSGMIGRLAQPARPVENGFEAAWVQEDSARNSAFAQPPIPA